MNHFWLQMAPHKSEIFFGSCGLVLLLGVILGLTRKITVFRDFNDLGLVYGMLMTAIATLRIMTIGVGYGGPTRALTFIAAAIECGLAIWIVIRTFQDNRNPLFAVLALLTKVTISVLFVVNLLGFLYSRKRDSRSDSILFMLVLAPLTLALVRNKSGIFSPQAMIQGRGASI